MERGISIFILGLIGTIIWCGLMLLTTGCVSTPEHRCRDAGLSVQKMTSEEMQGIQNSRVECVKPKELRR